MFQELQTSLDYKLRLDEAQHLAEILTKITNKDLKQISKSGEPSSKRDCYSRKLANNLQKNEPLLTFLQDIYLNKREDLLKITKENISSFMTSTEKPETLEQEKTTEQNLTDIHLTADSNFSSPSTLPRENSPLQSPDSEHNKTAKLIDLSSELSQDDSLTADPPSFKYNKDSTLESEEICSEQTGINMDIPGNNDPEKFPQTPNNPNEMDPNNMNNENEPHLEINNDEDIILDTIHCRTITEDTQSSYELGLLPPKFSRSDDLDVHEFMVHVETCKQLNNWNEK